MKNLIEDLYPMDRYLLGAGYDSALEYLRKLISLDVINISSGTKLGTWTVPDEWIPKEAWIKNKKTGKKIFDMKDSPLTLAVGSHPQKKTVDREELYKHLYYLEDKNTIPYMFHYYNDKDTWGFSVNKNKIYKENPKKRKEGEFLPTFVKKLPKGDYEVFIDAEYKPGTMKIGVHTIPGKTDKEILLFAHLDHPYQANDNLSGVACLVDLAKDIKSDYTIKIVICPETIGSIGYALLEDIDKVEFMLAVDICGNKGSLLLQKSFMDHRVNKAAHVAIHSFGESYRKGKFRATIGSDEYVFNDPQLNIPGLMLSTHPYPEYHTADDTPEIIDYDAIKKTGDIIKKIIEIYEKDFIPKKEFKGQLMRSRYDIQSMNSQFNLSWDYLIYSMDGKKSLAELCNDFGLNFDQVYEVMLKLENDKFISRVDISEVRK